MSVSQSIKIGPSVVSVFFDATTPSQLYWITKSKKKQQPGGMTLFTVVLVVVVVAIHLLCCIMSVLRSCHALGYD